MFIILIPKNRMIGVKKGSKKIFTVADLVKSGNLTEILFREFRELVKNSIYGLGSWGY
jgi:hypothetical protein